MNILMVTMGLDIGGAETHIVELSKQLKAMGHEVSIISNGGVYVPEILAAGIRHYRAPLHRRNLWYMIRSRAIIKDVIAKEHPDIVHAHARIPAFLCGTLKRNMKFPFVTTAHWVFQSDGLLRYLSNWGERTVAVSHDIKNYLIREYHVPEWHISVTINGIDTDKFSPSVTRAKILEEFHLDGYRPILSYVSRMDEDRALVARQLIQIAPRLNAALPGVQMVLTGGGNLLESLKREADAVNQSLGRTCIVMTGPRIDINEIVSTGDLFIGVSRSALEAMSAGKPVIVAGNEGYQGLFGPDKLEQARQGNFCCRGLPQSDPNRLLEDILTFFRLSNRDRGLLGSYGRQVILKFYSVQRMAQDCLDMYEQVRHRKYQVVMSGYYGFNNAGDDAILQSIHQSIQKASSEISLTVLSNDPEQTERRYGVKSLHRFRLWSVFRALLGSDALLSGGGSLLQDRTSTRSILYYLSILRAARLLGKPVMLYANGIGPVLKRGNRRRVMRAVERANVVTLRDHSSVQELREMGVQRSDLHVTADPVFHLDPVGRGRTVELLRSAGLSASTPFVAVSVRDWPDTDAFFPELAALCDHLHQAYGLESLFVMMQPEKDRSASQLVRSYMNAPSHLLHPCSPRELMGVLGEGKLCLAMRLHTLIFAARMAVPILGLVYDPKVGSFLEELGMPSAGDVDQFNREAAIEQADQLMARYGSCHDHLRERSVALSQAAWENEKFLLHLLESQSNRK